MVGKTAVATVAFAVALSSLCWGEDPKSGAELAFNKLRSLSGDWQGSYQWTGARNSSGKMDATYYMSGNDSALVENLLSDGKPSMTSVYHLDGNDLRMTHYCAARNQPRLKAEHIDLEKGTFEFSFVDATNLRSPDAPHVDGLK